MKEQQPAAPETYRCQSCGAESPVKEWGQGGVVCPRCGAEFDPAAAQTLDLDAIEARERAAASGPWFWRQSYELDRLHWALFSTESASRGCVIDASLVLYHSLPNWLDNKPADVNPNWQFIAQAREDVPALVAEVRRLAAFKAYVHRRLDEAGVPADPDGPHRAEGCRIGGRLDLVLARWAGGAAATEDRR